MITKIFKYVISPSLAELCECHEIKMPAGAVILDIQHQKKASALFAGTDGFGPICLWAMVDQYADEVTRRINVYGTGHEMREIEQKYISTVQFENGSLVFHFFDLGESQ